MKTIAGAIVVLAGSLIMGLSSNDIPNEALPTLMSIGLIILGLVIMFTGSSSTMKNDVH